jgi:hypothetical protein
LMNVPGATVLAKRIAQIAVEEVVPLNMITTAANTGT